MISYPLRFFNTSPQAQMLMQANPGSVLDITMPSGLLIPVCQECGNGDFLLREEKEGLTRYRCSTCGSTTDWSDRDTAALQWTNRNSELIPTN